MKTEDQYLKFVRWSEEDNAYIGYCPDLFPWGGVCHGDDEEQTYRELRELVTEEIKQLMASGKDPSPSNYSPDARTCWRLKNRGNRHCRLDLYRAQSADWTFPVACYWRARAIRDPRRNSLAVSLRDLQNLS